MRDAGAAVTLYDKKRIEKPGSKLKAFSFETPVFESSKVTECVKEVLSDIKYKQAAMKLKMLSKSMGGRELAMKSIERHYITGASHLVDDNFNKKYNKMNLCCSCMSILILLGVIVSLAYFTVCYYHISK